MSPLHRTAFTRQFFNHENKILLTLLVLMPSGLWAIPITEPARIFHVGVGIGDLQDPPAIFSVSINDSDIVSITKVEVGLRLVGNPAGDGFASEMHVLLNKDLTQTAILLNQAGMSVNDPVGAFYDGWDVTFSDTAPNGDIHLPLLETGVLVGHWQPDGRVDPLSNLRPAMLGVFNNSPANGIWRLGISDLYLGGSMRLETWSIVFSGHTRVERIPDPGPSIVGFVVWLFLFISATRRA